MTLLVIDTQKGITDDRLYEFEKFKANVKELISLARANGVEVVFVQHDDGPGTGFSVGDVDYEIYDEFAPVGPERIFAKAVNSALHPSTDLYEYLKEKKEVSLMIVGLMTNFCIDATIKTAFDLGFEIYVPEYANSTSDNEYMDKETCYNYHNKFLWPDRFANCISMEEARELLRG